MSATTYAEDIAARGCSEAETRAALANRLADTKDALVDGATDYVEALVSEIEGTADRARYDTAALGVTFEEAETKHGAALATTTMFLAGTGVVRLDAAERDLLVKHLVFEAQMVMEEAAGSNVAGAVDVFRDGISVVEEIAETIRELWEHGATARFHTIRGISKELLDMMRATVGIEATLLQRMEEGDPLGGHGPVSKMERKATRRDLKRVTRECAIAERIWESVRLADPRSPLQSKAVA